MGGRLVLAALEPKFWTAFCAAAGRDDLAGRGWEKDARSESRLSSPRATWLPGRKLGRTHDVCLEPVREGLEVTTDPHFVARKMFFEAGALPALRTATAIDLPSLPGRRPQARTPGRRSRRQAPTRRSSTASLPAETSTVLEEEPAMASTRITDSLQTILWATGALSLFFVLNSFFPDLGQRLLATHVEKGRASDVSITLVTADAEGLACAMDGERGRLALRPTIGKGQARRGRQPHPGAVHDGGQPEPLPHPRSLVRASAQGAAPGRSPARLHALQALRGELQVHPPGSAKDFLCGGRPRASGATARAPWVGSIAGCTIRG